MALFKKKTEGLPDLPDFPDDGSREALPQLPSFPNSPLGDRFSNNAIKEAVAPEEEKEDFDEDLPTKKSFTQEIAPFQPVTRRKEIPRGFEEAASRVRKTEPIFIRLDKFEESLHTFKKVKEKVTEIEKMLQQTKRVKEEEEKELEYWETEIQKIKEQVEEIDKEIFSKVE